jgi:hypothetical protein
MNYRRESQIRRNKKKLKNLKTAMTYTLARHRFFLEGPFGNGETLVKTDRDAHVDN